MLSSKSKSGLFEASATKAAPPTPRSSKLSKSGSFKGDLDLHSPNQASRVSVDRSPKSDPKPAVERRSPRISTPPDKQSRVIKGSQAQFQLGAVQEDVKRVKEKLSSVEKETNRLIEELKEAKKSAEEANDKLIEALASQKRAEEASENDKFRADELEQVSVEGVQKREKEWQKELEDVRNQHALDVAALGALTQELQRVKQELLMTTEAKNSALNHADDAVKIAEINADKVELLSKEVNRLKTLLDSAVENKSSEGKEHFKNDLDLQTQLTSVQNELKKANALLDSVGQEKSRILDELKDAKKLYDEANQRLQENLASQQKVHEVVELEKSRSEELEKERIKAAEKREVEWQEKLESIRNQHAADVASFTSIGEELERVKHELVMTADAKNAALSHADDALKIAEVNAEKVKLLSGEITHLKSQLDSKLELEAEVLNLKGEVQKSKEAEKKLAEMEALIVELRTNASNAKKAETDAQQLLEEWKKKAELLEVQLEEEKQSRNSSLDSLATVRKQLEERNHVMQEKETEILVLKTNVDSLELDIARFKTDIHESARCLNMAKEEAFELIKMVENLKSEIRIIEDEKLNALSNEKEAASIIESLMYEKNKLVSELEITRSDAEKDKQVMEELSCALREASNEAREAQEKFSLMKVEAENAHTQIEDLKLTIKKIEGNRDVALKAAKHEILQLQETTERLEKEVDRSVTEWESKEINFVGSITMLEEDITRIKFEMGKIAESLNGAELKLQAANENEVRLQNKLKNLESEANAARQVADDVKMESCRLKEILFDKKNELQSICQDNDDLRVREAAASKKAEELSSLLNEAKMESCQLKEMLLNKENELQSICQLNDDLRVLEAAASKKSEELSSLLAEAKTKQKENAEQSPIDNSEENVGEQVEADKTKCEEEASTRKIEAHSRVNQITKVENGKENNKAESLKLEDDMLENGKAKDKELSNLKEQESESTDDELDPKINSVSFDQASELASENASNGANSPMKEHQQQQKKKKAFIQKFGSLLKKKSNTKEGSL